jgi:hypothetical protein
MKTHLKTTLTLLCGAAIIASFYFFPLMTIGAICIAFLYASLYTDIKETENEKKKNGEYNRTTEGDI